ncbi:MAG: hypothetical protein EBX02_11150 [Betaproteobacteria bacterium]|nr:hypothetical protein [Betaproteobacteria bacterium]
MSACHQNAKGDRQLKTVAVLWQIGRRKVHCEALLRKLKAALADGRTHPLARLANQRGWQANEMKRGKSPGDLHFDADGNGVQAK